MAINDYDDVAFIVLRRTLYLWLFPYIFWYFGREIWERVYDWVTEPVSGEDRG